MITSGPRARTNPLIVPSEADKPNGLSPQTTYEVQVRAGEAEGTCTCPWRHVQVKTLGTLGQVTGVTVTSKLREIEVSWLALTGATGYRVQWKSAEQSYSNAVQYATVYAPDTSFTISHATVGSRWLTVGTEYTVRVYGVTDEDNTPADIGPGPVSAEHTGTALSALPPQTPQGQAPGQVTGLSLTAGVRQIAAAWTADAQATGYQVQWKSGSESFDTGRQATTTGTGHVISNLAQGTAFTVRVRATNSHGNGAWSAEATATTEQAQTPTFPAVTGVYADPVKDADGDNRIHVWWNAQSTTDNPNGDYRVQYRPEGHPWSSLITSGPGSRTNPLVLPSEADAPDGLTGNRRYEVWVRAGEDGACTCPWTRVPLTTLGTLGQVTGVTVTPGGNSLTVSWSPLTGAGRYRVQWKSGTQSFGSPGPVPRHKDASGLNTTTITIPNLTAETEYTVRVNGWATAGPGPWSDEVTATTLRATPVSDGDGSGGDGSSGGGGGGDGSSGGGGGGGGGGGRSRDLHGNTPARATTLAFRPASPRRATANGQISPASDRDYFTIEVPRAGLLIVETTGRTDTAGTVWQHDEELATAVQGGERRNFRLSTPVEAGPVVIAVTSNGNRTGAYTLVVRLVVGFFENPRPGSHQSGIGVISGWVCEADTVEVQFETGTTGETRTELAALGTLRPDTEPECGDTDNGFGLLWNWNRLGDGEHTVRALVDGEVFAEHTLTVTTLGLGEFPTGLSGTTTVPDFPDAGATTTLQWHQALQNFVILPPDPASEVEQGGAQHQPATALLENPQPGSFQSGIGVISGWVCEADTVEIQFEHGTTGATRTVAAGAGTARPDTEHVCGDTDNGFGLLWNWNRLGDGEHIVRAFADGEEFAWSRLTVTTLGEEFARGLAGTATVADFPAEGQAVTVEWQEALQNFTVTGRQ